MRYICESDITQMKLKWEELIDRIDETSFCLSRNDFAQPIKPYLRYGNSKNRIIAMPAYVGGEIESSGIKWISSFPDNVKKGLRRAHSVTIVNDSKNGIPKAIINTPLLSIYRTVAVTGAMLRRCAKSIKADIKVLLIGLGPIGEHHYLLMRELYGQFLKQIYIYDISSERIAQFMNKHQIDQKLCIAANWVEAYSESDIVITCTVASEPYITEKPKQGSIHLNVSLRDYDESIREYFNQIVVDNWDEVCREGTSIERCYKAGCLKESDTLVLSDLIANASELQQGNTVFFNPMGMAVFDIAIADYYLSRAESEGIGTILEGVKQTI